MKFSNDPLFVQRRATFSACRRYRYTLDIVWDASLPLAGFIGLNPSTADEFADDNTIRRCRGFAEREGCGGMRMLNLFAFRATDPKVMKREPEPIGLENDLAALLEGVTGPRIACWGSHGTHLGRGRAVAASLPRLLCFGVTKEGHPVHPLYLKGSAPLDFYAGWTDWEMESIAHDQAGQEAAEEDSAGSLHF